MKWHEIQLAFYWGNCHCQENISDVKFTRNIGACVSRDQTAPQKEQSDQSLHSLPFNLQLLDTLLHCKAILLKCRPVKIIILGVPLFRMFIVFFICHPHYQVMQCHSGGQIQPIKLHKVTAHSVYCLPYQLFKCEKTTVHGIYDKHESNLIRK